MSEGRRHPGRERKTGRETITKRWKDRHIGRAKRCKDRQNTSNKIERGKRRREKTSGQLN